MPTRHRNVPADRVRQTNEHPVRADGRYVLYWMVAARRLTANHALQRAVEWCRQLGKPLLILDALRCDYPWACDRFHAFVLQGMHDHAAALKKTPGVRYHAYVEPERRAGRGLLEALAQHAAVVVTDHFPGYFLPRMVRAAAAKLDVKLEAVDGNGILPLAALPKALARAVDFRRALQKNVAPHLAGAPTDQPLSQMPPGLKAPSLPASVNQRWPATPSDQLSAPAALLATLPIDHSVGVVRDLPGGATAAADRLQRFVTHALDRYAEDGRHPDENATSGLSPYLHFGHIGAHEILQAVLFHHGRDLDDVAAAADAAAGSARGSKDGWFGLPESAASFLDELVTWRELAFNNAEHDPRHEQYDSVPAWARATLADHAHDKRPAIYSLDQLAAGQTSDGLWNAAQAELRDDGRMNGYLRMLWGKRILEWTRGPEDALAAMVELNNRYAIDGRDPNSYAGILWVLGKHDRAWGPERKIFGKVRYMTSANTRRKLRLTRYLERYG